jgi:hypothetical protein
MSELEEIAASVAKALGLEPVSGSAYEGMWDSGTGYYLGPNWIGLFDEFWQARCRDWLHAQGYEIRSTLDAATLKVTDVDPLGLDIIIQCPAAEFCARAIHELMKRPE